ncbi:gamma-glutamylcysteine synthetase [Streptococcus vestibularis]|uniref:gamma-glutamylcysteine synthetase n=1 Tax=Streptococcus vestibularis TaxID=1343 RepID=UPI00232BE408|nr:gamma-glutamylcysteine synthetase [Streptococcus vestibularis]MDB6183487.1 gamma-glutamylcysteine synthetase [Streptococcus vestibularis]MDB6200639.1 gamma-glutamylcysteine synthetase [Streptococcus vestibularis]MDB6207050.1 gamma-glutamylcysteine synthetase [Streptococcus vestibularis]MDB6210848.1 gamma-glutamylcysteine synthetase [Streptococcus vestibularis]MDB6214883.1 gamma-glutamylcysteine synthetase [Streptococcus vestibularis]
MTTAKELLKQRYYEPIKEQPELFVGIELEYPVVNLSGNATDVSLTKQLLVYLLDNFDFQADKYDSDNNPIQLIDEASGDMILFEVSYNTIEFAFAKAERISEVEERLDAYLSMIQPYLQNDNHELQGWGVNPNWAKNDNRPVKSPRYEMLMDFLELSKAKNDSFFHDYPEYGSFICGSQVQLDVSKTSYLRVLNAFNQIEGPKAVLFANSEFWGSDWDLALSRDVFWENSMHGVFEENAGVFPKVFKSEDDYFSYLSETAIFTAKRGDETYYFEPIRAKDYLSTPSVKARSIHGEVVTIEPSEEDFKTHRSYQFQDLTTRGTVEFRSVCTQPFSATFASAALHLGLLVNLETLESILKDTSLFEVFDYDYPRIRCLFSKKEISKDHFKLILPLTEALLTCAEDGLKNRGFGEEVYLAPLQERLAALKNRLD